MHAQIEKLRNHFEDYFIAYLDSKVPYQHLDRSGGEADVWLGSSGLAALGAQVIVLPQYDLSIPRLETMAGLIPDDESISIITSTGNRKCRYLGVYSFAQSYERKILGGVVAFQEGGFSKQVKILRSGEITVSFMQVRDEQSCTCFSNLIATAAGFALGAFDRLRKKSSYPIAPAVITLDICTRRKVGVGGYQGYSDEGSYGRLQERSIFPLYTLGTSDDITTMLQEIGSDLMNAGGLTASSLPKIAWDDPH